MAAAHTPLIRAGRFGSDPLFRVLYNAPIGPCRIRQISIPSLFVSRYSLAVHVFFFSVFSFFATGGTLGIGPSEERESSEDSVKYRTVMEGKYE